MRISDWSSDVCSSDLILLVQIPGGQFHNKRCDLGVVRVEFPTVKVEEGFCHYQCRPLVPIHKRMVARNSESVACRSEEHTSELQSLMRISYAVFCLKKKKKKNTTKQHTNKQNTNNITNSHSRKTNNTYTDHINK